MNRTRIRRSLGLLLLISSLGACRSQAEREASRQIARIAHAVDRLRDAPNNAKTEPLELLKLESCSVAQACELQQICVQGYVLHERAMSTSNRIREALRAGSQANEAAVQLLAHAEQDLTRAKALTDQCVALEGRLAREYF